MGDSLLNRLERKRSIRQSRIATSFSHLGDERAPSDELVEIVKKEGLHFPKDRLLKIVSTFLVLFATLISINSLLSSVRIWEIIIKTVIFLSFIAFCILMTYLNARELRRIHHIKRREAYEYDESDLHFEK